MLIFQLIFKSPVPSQFPIVYDVNRVVLFIDCVAPVSNAGAPFLLGSIIMVAAIAIACTLDPQAGRGHAHFASLLHSDDEADVEAAAGNHPAHFSDFPASNTVRFLKINRPIARATQWLNSAACRLLSPFRCACR